ncbi:recombination protein RecR [Candidatus Babeliales bacterium]|nr:recombination protein RecR [Candidatus Babeliales bacterium]
MFNSLPSLQKLIKQLQKVPYLASKNIYRVAIYFLTSSNDEVEQFCNILLEAKKKVKSCCKCFNLTQDSQVCSICLSEKREKSIICVVETWHDLFAIERAGGYNGLYHVLGGALCPLEGIGIDNLNIDSLLKRIDKSVKEVIFATNPTPEGEATASYISSKLSELEGDLKFDISKLVSGVPIGSSLEYMDRVTIYKALSGRRPF